MKARSVTVLFVLVSQLWLHGSGDEVVVVYNSKLSDSKAVAEYYASKRGVPKSQVFGFAMSKAEEISRKEFQDEIQVPLANKLASANLWRIGTREFTDTNGSPVRLTDRVLESKIRYVLLCYGVPLRVRKDKELIEPAEARLRPELRRNEASVDSELTCLPVLKLALPLTGFRENPVYQATNTARIHPTNGVLIVARLDGPTAAMARGLVDKALQAERNGLWGRAYIDLRNTPERALKQGDDWIRAAGEACKRAGFETVVDERGAMFPAGFPLSQIAFYAGWYSESMHGAFTSPTIEFMPGAFAYHLHSLSAASMRNTDRNWVGPLLAKGVTATMGTVEEPYLGGTPDIGVFAACWLQLGMTFGEAATAAQTVLSWQTTVVGDPLYRALASPVRELHESLERRHADELEWSYLRLANFGLGQGRSLSEVTTQLEEVPTTKTSAVLKEKLGDLYAAQGKPSSAALAYEQALKLNPSPLQRLRLRLALDEKFSALDRHADALANLESLLKETPDYPDKLSVYRKLAAAATKAGNSAAAAKYEAQVKALTPPK